MKEDIIDIEIDFETGLIKSTTPKISAANHSNASQFFSFLARLAGGATQATKKHTHTHVNETEQDTLKGGN